MIKAVIFDMYETLITHYACPLYFGEQMAADAGIENEKFQQIWEPAGTDRTIGKVTLEEILEKILRANDCYSEAKMNAIVAKRIHCKEEAFTHLHSEIIPLLTELKKRGMLTGLISNCFSEEAAVIKESVLYPFFDAVCLSFEEGLQKPDPAIYQRCLARLGLRPEECIYIGDGGSDELETAQKLGMKALQAVWYLKDGAAQHRRKAAFKQLETPFEVFRFI